MPISLGIGTAVTRGGGLYGPPPQLDLNFASLLSLTPSVGPTPSFTRASTGTFFDASGVLTTAAINGPRFDHVYNGSSWVSKGLLIEEQRTNLFQYSQVFSNAYWNKYQSTASTDTTVSPDGLNLAWLFTENTANDSHALRRQITGFTTGTYALSCYVKAGSRNWIIINLSETGIDDRRTWFNLSSGTIGTNAAGNTATITNVGNGWYRCSASRSVSVTNPNFDVGLATSDGVSGYIGDGTSGAYFWGAQLELGAFPTSYIPTTTASVTRSADVCQITGGDFSGFYNQSEGSFAVAYDCPANGVSVQYQATSAPSNNNVDAVSIGTTQYFEVYLPPTQALINAGSIASNVSQSLSSAYKLNDFAASLNGGAVATDTAGSLPAPTKLIIGSDGSVYNNGHIARLRYFNTRLINSQLVALST